ncbi:MAG: ATP/GTP-binding protein [Acidilobaceae archaeon]
MTKVVMFVGPAGAGKSSLTAAYGKWLREVQDLEVSLINMDPATEFVPYEPDYDIRKFVNVKDLIIKLGLGPNGALMKALEIVKEDLEKHVKSMMKISRDYMLVDTPGQMDLFLLSGFGLDLVNALREVSRERVLVLFVIDATTILRPEDYAFAVILGASLRGKLGCEVVPVVNKIDLNPVLKFTGDLRRDSEALAEYLKEGRVIYGEFLSELLDVVVKYVKSIKVPHVSAKIGLGMEELHRVAHEFLCACGDLT